MGKIRVEYKGGESCVTAGQAVDYMLAKWTDADGDEQELYAEAEPVDGDERGTEEELRAEIIRQAEEAGIAVERLDFAE